MSYCGEIEACFFVVGSKKAAGEYRLLVVFANAASSSLRIRRICSPVW